MIGRLTEEGRDRDMQPKRQHRIVGRRNERGSVLAIATVGMLAVLLVAGLCIDFNHLYMVQIEMQAAADAAAIAAASQLNTTSGGIKAAVTEATKTLNKYNTNTDVTIPASSVTFAVNLNGSYIDWTSAQVSPANIRFVKVAIPPKPVTMSFLSSVIGSTQYIGATATGGMSVALTMNKYYSAMIIIENDGCGMEPGMTYTLSPKVWNSSSPNSYRVLAGTGGDLILTGTIHAYGYANGTYTVAQLSQSDDARLARIGINTRFDDYSWHPNTNATDEPPDTIVSENINYATYRQMQGYGAVERSYGVENRRIITLPIAATSDYNTYTRNVTANKLGAFFLPNKMGTDGNLIVEYIGTHLVVPMGEYRAGGIQLNELSRAVLYK